MSSPPIITHPFVIEEALPLSESKLWTLQRQMYIGLGVRAWRRSGTPHYVTDNSFVARCYARVTLTHLRSVLAGNADARRKGACILELGAGAGRFGFHFLEHFWSMWRDSELGAVPVTYLMTDLAPNNVEFYRRHPAFAPYVERGQLAFSACDAEAPASLQHAMEGSAPGKRGCPLVVFANYVFDSLRHDLFYCEGGRLYEGLVSLKGTAPDVDQNDPLATLALEVARRPAETPPSTDPVWNRILDSYRTRNGQGAVLFPSSGLRLIQRLRGLAPESLLVLAADEGSPRAEVVASRGPRFLTNGSLSLPSVPVNFHALGEYAAADGGQAHFASHEADGFCMAALVWDGAGRDCGATREAFRDVMDLFGPAEFFSIVKSLERTASDLTCQEMLAHLRWSAWDPQVLHTLLPSLRERLPAAPPTEIAAWRDAMARVWSLYYHFDAEEGDLAFGIGATFARLGEWKAAITFFERSRQLWGDDGNTLYNLGVCHARLGDRPAALACVEGVLAAKPDHEQALKLRRELGTKSEPVRRAWLRTP